MFVAIIAAIQSSLPGYCAFGKKQWIAEIKKIHRRDGNIFARRLQEKMPHLYFQGKWLFGTWDNALRAAGFIPGEMRLHRTWDTEKVSKAIRNLRHRRQQLNAHYVAKHNPALFQAGLRYYGRWNKALRAAGISTTRILKNSTARRKLLKTLQGKGRSAISESLRLQADLYFGDL